MMNFKHNEVNFEVLYEGYPDCLKTYFMSNLRYFGDNNI